MGRNAKSADSIGKPALSELQGGGVGSSSPISKSEGFAHLVHVVELLPGEELYGDVLVVLVA